MSYKVGIDVGSTTLKTVVLGDEGQIIEKSYQRHFSKVREMTVEHLKSLEHLLRGHPLKVAVTGSAGLGIAKNSGLEFVQEVFATAGAVRRTIHRQTWISSWAARTPKSSFCRALWRSG